MLLLLLLQKPEDADSDVDSVSDVVVDVMAWSLLRPRRS